MRIVSLKVIFLSFFFFFFLFPAFITSNDQGSCSPTTCIEGEPQIRFPFRLEDPQLSQCGYPGFNLACNNMSKTVLKLPSSGIFFVRDVNYISQAIKVYDPDNCLPRRFLYLNLSGSPFKIVYYQNYTLFSCSSSNDLTNSSFMPIGCLGSSTYKVWATNTSSVAVITGCQLVANVKVPIRRPGDSLGLENDLLLTWNNPYCGLCETVGSECGADSSSGEIRCFAISHQRHHGHTGIPGLIICIIVGLTLGLSPVVIYLIAYMYKRLVKSSSGGGGDGDGDGGERHPSDAELSIVELSAAIPPQLEHHHGFGFYDSSSFERYFPIPTRIHKGGLDDSTIDSFKKIVLGESGRLPKPDDDTCPICLEEYEPKEILKLIPECNHSFHTDCIDKWFVMDSTCPSCRRYLLPKFPYL